MSRLRAIVLLFASTSPLACANLYGVSDLPIPGPDASGDVTTVGKSDGAADAAKHDAAVDAPRGDVSQDTGHVDADHADAGSETSTADAHAEAAPGDARADATDALTDTLTDVTDARPLDAVSDVSPGDAPADSVADAPTDSVEVTPSIAWIQQGASLTLQVTLASAVAVATPVNVSSLPAGVTAGALTIAAGSDTGNLVLDATASATEGLVTPTVTVGSHDAQFSLVVAGASGTFDDSFNGAGVTNQTPPGGGTTGSMATSLAVLSNGDVIVGGVLSAPEAPLSGWAVVAVKPDGTPDTAFNANLADTNKGNGIPITGALAAIAAGPGTDKIAVVGSVNSGSMYDIAVWLLNPDGSRDEAFGTNGMLTYGSTNDWEVPAVSATGVAMDAAGEIAVVGATKTGGAYLLVLSATDGSVVGAVTDFQSGVVLTGVSYLPSGDLAVGGYGPSGGGQFFVAHVLDEFGPVSSILDQKTFGPGDAGSEYLVSTGVSADPSGQVFVVGNQSRYTALPAMTSVALDGGCPVVGGYADPGPTSPLDGNLGYLGVASDRAGRAVTVGWGYDQSEYLGWVVRMKADGTADTSFATAGIATLHSGSDTAVLALNAVAFDSVGRILVAGNRGAGFYIVRMWP